MSRKRKTISSANTRKSNENLQSESNFLEPVKWLSNIRYICNLNTKSFPNADQPETDPFIHFAGKNDEEFDNGKWHSIKCCFVPILDIVCEFRTLSASLDRNVVVSAITWLAFTLALPDCYVRTNDHSRATVRDEQHKLQYAFTIKSKGFVIFVSIVYGFLCVLLQNKLPF